MAEDGRLSAGPQAERKLGRIPSVCLHPGDGGTSDAATIWATLAGVLYLSDNAGPIEPINGRKAGVMFLTFAVSLLLIAETAQSGSAALADPDRGYCFQLVDTTFELLVRHDPRFIPPMIMEPIFLTLYLGGYWRLMALFQMKATIELRRNA